VNRTLKPSHITQAYKSNQKPPIVQHTGRSIRKISPKKQYIQFKRSCTTDQQKNELNNKVTKPITITNPAETS
jgi:hypothetical protein